MDEQQFSNIRRKLFSVSTMILVMILSACGEKQYCKLRYASWGVYKNFPDKPLGSVERKDIRFFAAVIMSQENPGSLLDIQRKKFLIRVWDKTDQTLLQDCVCLEAGEYSINFQWDIAEELSIVFSYVDGNQFHKKITMRYILDPEMGRFVETNNDVGRLDNNKL